MVVPENVPLKVIDPVTPNFDPLKVRFDSTVPFGAVPFNVIIPLSVVPVRESNPDVPEVPLVPSPPAAPSKLVVQLENVPTGVDISVTLTVSEPVKVVYETTSPWKCSVLEYAMIKCCAIE